MMKPDLAKALLLTLLVSGAVMALVFRQELDIAILKDWVSQAGMSGPLIFMLIYILATIFFIPGSVMTLAGGALFGPIAGVIYNLGGATAGAVIAFITARYVARDWVESKASSRLQTLQQGVETDGWKFVAFVRLTPVFPFNLLNYALGLTRIKLGQYSLTSALCMLPGAIAYTYLGAVGEAALAGDEAIIQKAMTALALLATTLMIAGVMRKFFARPVSD